MVVSAACVGSDTDGAGAAAGAGPEGGAGADGGNNVDVTCNQADGGCVCDAVHEGIQRACGQDGPGTCTKGTHTCKAGAWTACTGVAPTDSEQACDGRDENCNGQVDEGLTITCFHDIDKDGYGNPDDKKEACPDPAAGTAPRYGCPDGYIRAEQNPGVDCKDTDPSIKPTAVQLCDSKDWDCDGKVRNGCPSTTETFGADSSSGIKGITATVGGCGTQVYGTSSTSCAAGVVGLSGFEGYPGSAFSTPTQFSLTCNDGTINEALATPEFAYSYVPSGANTASPLTGPGRADDKAGGATCDAGQWVVGFKWTSSCLFDRVKILCAPITFTGSGPTWTATTGTVTEKYALGDPSSSLGESAYQCPSGSVVTDLTEWHTTGSATDSNYVSGFKIGCKKLGFVPQ